MTSFRLTRSDKSVLGRWWWTVDHWILAALALLIGYGVILIQAATPAIATHYGLDPFYFTQRHVAGLIPAVALMLGVSLLTPRQALWGAAGLLAVTLPLLAATLVLGAEVKGATRWLDLFGVSLQPSEFVKPALIVVAAWLFARQQERPQGYAWALNAVLYGAVVVGLLGQPDLGMTVLVSCVWFGQFFLAGMSVRAAGGVAFAGAAGLVGAYYVFPHVTARVDRFLGHGDTYQTDRALEAFAHGGVWGVGPGEGTVKLTLPDAHADFVMAVAGEELGLIGCLLIVGLFAFIAVRGLGRLRQENNLFILLASAGLLISFGLQALINMSSTLHIIPAKGMTLPFVSYGRSSLWATGLGMGLLLAFTRKRYGLSGL